MFSGKKDAGNNGAEELSRQQSEEQMRALNEQMMVIFDSSPTMIFYKDKENRFIRVNEAFAKANNKSKQEIEGKSCWDIYSKEAADHYMQDDQEVMAAGEPKLNIIETMETPAGTMWVQTDKILHRDQEGKIIGIIGFTLDITERINMEQKLKASEEKYRSIIESSTDAIFVMDKEYKYVSVNESFAGDFKKSVQELIGKSVFEIFPETVATGLAKNVQKVFDSGCGITVDEEVSILGQKQYINSKLNPIKGENGAVVAVTGIVRDIAEIRKEEDALKEMNVMMTGRELKMIELKKEVEELKAKLQEATNRLVA